MKYYTHLYKEASKMLISSVSLSILFTFTLVIVSECKTVDWNEKTPLDDYVNRPDPNYRWEEIDQYRVDGSTIYVLNMTSQKWMTDKFSSQSIWWHYMYVCVPDKVKVKDMGILFIDGNKNRSPMQPDDFHLLILNELASYSGLVVTLLMQIPNQPIAFPGDFKRDRTEDSLIAYTWRKFLDDPTNPEVVLQLPMTKAAKRGLDTIQAFTKMKFPDFNIDRFLVTGASKRAWITWLLASVDKRVKAIVPLCETLLNGQKTMMKHYRSLGGWTFAFKAYHEMNITAFLTDPKFLNLYFIDPYAYRQRLTMPKMVVVGSGDEFFLLDDSHFFFSELPEPKFMMLAENAQHILFPHYFEIFSNILALFHSVHKGLDMPKISWIRNETESWGSIILHAPKKPHNLTVWSAETLDDDPKRDFRMLAGKDPWIHPVFWYENAADIEDLGNGYYRVQYKSIPKKWFGFFMKMSYPGPEDTEFVISTEVNIIPYTYPFPPCKGAECIADLV